MVVIHCFFSAPVGVQAYRYCALRLIHRDLSQRGSPVGAENIERLYRLAWAGKSSWRRSRGDAGSQPSQPALTAALVYMRECLIAYATTSAASSPHGSPPLLRLPRFGPRHVLAPEDLRAVTDHLRGPC